MADTVDPLAGSYYIEKLTDEIETRAQAYIDTIEKMGGPVAAIEKGYVQKEIQESAYRYQKEIEANERIIVGLNKFQVKEEKPKELLKVDPTVRGSAGGPAPGTQRSEESKRSQERPGSWSGRQPRPEPT